MSATSTMQNASADADVPARTRPRRAVAAARAAGAARRLGRHGVLAHPQAAAAGTHVESAWRAVPAANVAFIADITAADAYGRPVMSQAIFDEVLGIVRSARALPGARLLPVQRPARRGGRGRAGARALQRAARCAASSSSRRNPDLRVLFITDPINDVYGGDPSADLADAARGRRRRGRHGPRSRCAIRTISTRACGASRSAGGTAAVAATAGCRIRSTRTRGHVTFGALGAAARTSRPIIAR